MDNDQDELVSRLEERAVYHEREAQRYKVAAEVVRAELKSGGASARSRRATSTSGKTSQMITKALTAAGVSLDAEALTQRMKVEGWETESQDPVALVRTAVRRMADRGELIKSVDNRFGLPGQAPAAAVTVEDVVAMT